MTTPKSGGFALPASSDIGRVLITDKQASDIYGMSTAWFRKQRVDGGGPPFVKLGNAVRYDQIKLAGWFEAREQNSTAAYKSHQKAPERSTRKSPN